MKVKIKKIDRDLPTPSYANKGDAGIDLYSSESFTLPGGARRLVKTGLTISEARRIIIQVKHKK